jgi:hypothetical protein
MWGIITWTPIATGKIDGSADNRFGNCRDTYCNKLVKLQLNQYIIKSQKDICFGGPATALPAFKVTAQK